MPSYLVVRFLISVNAHSKDLEPLTQENVQMFVEWCEQHSDWWRTRGQKPSGAAEDDPLKVAQTKPCPGDDMLSVGKAYGLLLKIFIDFIYR